MPFVADSDRKSSYKLPPTTIRDKLVSQDARRNKRRAQRVDSARQLDIFADLTLGESDDENAEDEAEGFTIAPTSVAQYAPMLSQGAVEAPPSVLDTSNVVSAIEIEAPAEASGSTVNVSPNRSKKNRPGKNKRRANKNKASKWADRCMYAELLEMNVDVPWDLAHDVDDGIPDGLPRDLETGWVAVAPVPAGKRCLAVTQQSAGVSGVVPNTMLRSRLLGKGLLARFPSALPPLTVLDCILDSRWRENGILHVLDVVKWKGQDVADCEAGFRFWWRDTRLSELADSPPPPTINFLTVQSPESISNPSTTPPATKYHFPYPTSFLPVPYHSNTTLMNLEQEVIPAAKTWREVNVSIPIDSTPSASGGMEIEPLDSTSPFAFASQQQSATLAPSSSGGTKPLISLVPASARIEPDGMLLYVSEASYEPGTSPLSSWVPIRGYDTHGDGPVAKEGPLDLFQRLIRRRISRQIVSGMSQMGIVDIEMET
ncbi:hypothetical protein D9613_008607 [Agrocybe pediades]|uniref:Snurportin-1 n=1 Tax=Agrocybe pediades TaxID=84607 RepID=A0A8H4QSP1_9AGAR|nr:hypothetical protein D9613_008607 [Agrocybe pediades]